MLNLGEWIYGVLHVLGWVNWGTGHMSEYSQKYEKYLIYVCLMYASTFLLNAFFIGV
jgi:hypothetical protein